MRTYTWNSYKFFDNLFILQPLARYFCRSRLHWECDNVIFVRPIISVPKLKNQLDTYAGTPKTLQTAYHSVVSFLYFHNDNVLTLLGDFAKLHCCISP
jgi:hypothetical protein